MRSDVPTGLTLLQYCRFIGFDPFTMAQFSDGFPTTSTPACDKPVFSHQWQYDFLSRDEFNQAINQAEAMIAAELGYWTYPRYIVGEKITYPMPGIVGMRGGGGNFKGQWKSVKLSYGMVQTPGILARTLINDNVAITRTDEDGDGVKETFEVTVNGIPAGTTADEIALYINAADRVSVFNGLSERWRIRPLYVSIAGDVATIRGHACLLVKPTLYEGFDNTGLDVTIDTNYLTAVSCYRVYTDTTATTVTPNQGIASWEALPCSESSGFTSYPVVLTPRNADLGFVGVDWSAANCTTNYEPDNVQVNYLAGLPLQDGMIDQTLGLAVAQLATALLPGLACGCNRSERIIAHWRAPIFESEGDEQTNFAPDDAGSNPFGVARGAVYAWRAVREYKQIWGIEL